MAYNKAKEEYRWKQWKSEEEKILREQGMDEETIQKLREYDWNDFNAERRFREHQTSLLDCMELLLEEKESGESQPESVEALLDTVDNEELLQILQLIGDALDIGCFHRLDYQHRHHFFLHFGHFSLIHRINPPVWSF